MNLSENLQIKSPGLWVGDLVTTHVKPKNTSFLAVDPWQLLLLLLFLSLLSVFCGCTVNQTHNCLYWKRQGSFWEKSYTECETRFTGLLPWQMLALQLFTALSVLSLKGFLSLYLPNYL